MLLTTDGLTTRLNADPSDLFLSPDLTEEQARAYLESLGFRDAAAVDEHFQRMADDLVAREALGRLAPDLLPAILESPDPDAAVAAIAQYVASRSGRAMFLDYLREDPRALHVLTYVMGASPQLGEILIRTPEYFHWLVSQVERSAPDRQDHEEELVSAFATIDDPVEGLNMLRRWKRRETLRIGTRDLLRHETVQTAVGAAVGRCGGRRRLRAGHRHAAAARRRGAGETARRVRRHRHRQPRRAAR